MLDTVLLFDVGQYGSSNDCGVLNNSEMGHRFQNGQLNLSDSEYLEGCNFDPLPYFLVGDEIFPIKIWLMRPIPGKFNLAEQICDNFNRILRARRVIENRFGILVARWRLYRTPIVASVENAESYVLGTLALHNYLRLTDNATYTTKGLVDSEN